MSRQKFTPTYLFSAICKGCNFCHLEADQQKGSTL